MLDSLHIEKIAIACSCKFHIDNFYTDAVRQHKVADTHKSNSKRVYTNEQINNLPIRIIGVAREIRRKI